MRNLMLILSAITVCALMSSGALADRICDGAVSPKACADHRAYIASIRDVPDTSPDYIKRLDPRYVGAMRDAGGGGSAGGSE